VLTVFEEEAADVDQGVGPLLARAACRLCLPIGAAGQTQGGVEDLPRQGIEAPVQAPAPLQGLRQVQAGPRLGGFPLVQGVFGQLGPVRMADATSVDDRGARSATISASCSAKSPTVRGDTPATMARTWPAESVPSTAAAAVSGSERSRVADRATRAASPATMAVRSRSQAVMEVAASRSHSSA
jgi:hypothetical protein